jgi:aminoglycoside phosphotransferase (APT) family kinase protein
MASSRLFCGSWLVGHRPSATVRGLHLHSIHAHRADCKSGTNVTENLLAYLRSRLGLPSLEYLALPKECPVGWEAHTYRFQLRGTAGLDPALAGPLVARIYCGQAGVPRVRHEAAVQTYLHQRGYPVPVPLLLEEDMELFGGPFLVQTRIEGRPLLEDLVRRPWRIVSAPRRMAVMHIRLHGLPSNGFPAIGEDVEAKALDEMGTRIRDYDLSGLRPGLDWLLSHHPEPRERSCIIHMDFHPLNLMVNHADDLVVLDWTESGVGDIHADVATTLMLLECMPAGVTTLWERATVATGRLWLRRWYLKAYRHRMPLDEAKLAYYRAWAAFGRLCRYGAWLKVGPGVTGSKASSLAHLQPRHIATLEAYFEKWTGVSVRVQPAARRRAFRWLAQLVRA